jgi:hypothetical protein
LQLRCADRHCPLRPLTATRRLQPHAICQDVHIDCTRNLSECTHCLHAQSVRVYSLIARAICQIVLIDCTRNPSDCTHRLHTQSVRVYSLIARAICQRVYLLVAHAMALCCSLKHQQRQMACVKIDLSFSQATAGWVWSYPRPGVGGPVTTNNPSDWFHIHHKDSFKLGPHIARNLSEHIYMYAYNPTHKSLSERLRTPIRKYPRVTCSRQVACV